MSKVRVELNDVVLVTKDKSSGDMFSGVCLYSISKEDRVGCYSDSWIASLFNGLFEGKIIVE